MKVKKDSPNKVAGMKSSGKASKPATIKGGKQNEAAKGKENQKT